MVDLEKLTWPVSKLGEALSALARRSGLAPRPIDVPRPPATLGQGDDEGALGQWVMAAAGRLGLEAEPVGAPYPELEGLIRGAAPALLRLRTGEELCFLALLRGGRRTVLVLTPDLEVQRLPLEAVRAALCQRIEASIRQEVDRLLEEAGVPQRRHARARTAILRQRLAGVGIGGCWLLRLAPGASFWRQVGQARLPRHLLAFVGAHAVQYVLLPLSWWLVGRGALQGRLEQGWLVAWALILLTMIPVRLLRLWWQSLFAIGVGGLLKKRLLFGALRLEPDEIRHQGAGQLLGRVAESEAVESLALIGGFLGLVSMIELIVGVVILSTGAGGGFHVLLLLVWVALTLFVAWRYFRSSTRWTEARRDMTHDLVERMVGHRTRLAQQVPERWHDGEDEALANYVGESRAMDQIITILWALVPRGWLVLGLLVLAPVFVAGQTSVEGLAIGLGGVLFVYQALKKLSGGLTTLVDAGVAWGQVAPLFRAAARPEVVGSPAFALTAASSAEVAENGQPVLDVHDVSFRYRERAEPVLRGCHLRIQPGDRLLLEGPSGGGKSTLTALLIGLRPLESGLVLLRGLDRQTLGADGWRRRVVAAPQFHENFILTETFLFNLLMGRGWPPRIEDVEEAEAICQELGLGDLLERMPAGLLQMVGESGWQLSHGERSRLYIARALLQGADLIVLDESFGALDPENLHQAMRCVLRRAPTLLVIAHL
jgi:ATP-binding cassette subfamily B protein